MRNLKRALSLALASVMLVGMMVVGTSAAYADVDANDNVEAIEVLQEVGIMVGDENGNFNPDALVTREQMAVIMSKLLDYKVSNYAGTAPFTDVADWAEPYVAACYTHGIIAGYSSTTFGGSDTVTAAQAALMMLKALGYFQYGSDFGDDWQLATVRKGNQIDLFDNVDAAVREAMTRSDVAQLALNALEATMVDVYGEPAKVVTSDGTTVSLGAAEYEELSKTGTKYAAIANVVDNNNKYFVELGEDLYDGDLEKTTSTDEFGRPSSVWSYKSAEIGKYADEPDEVWTGKVTEKALYQAAGSSAYDNYTWTIYIDGNTYGAGVQMTQGNNAHNQVVLPNGKNSTERWLQTGEGVVTELYVDSTNNTAVVAIINTFVGEVTKVTGSEGDYEVTVAFQGPRPNGVDTTYDSDVKFEKDDIVIMTVGGTEIKSMAVAETVSGEISAVKTNDYVTIDGTKYTFNRAYTGGAAPRLLAGLVDLDNGGNAAQISVENDVTLYLDAYGYPVAIEGAEDSVEDYLFIAGLDSSFQTDVEAKVVFSDGTKAKISIDEVTTYNNNVATTVDAAQASLSNGQIWKYSKGANDYDLEQPTGYSVRRLTNNTTITRDSAVVDNLVADSNTVYIDCDDAKVWTGYKSVPTLTGVTGSVIYDGSLAKVVFMASLTGNTSSDDDYIFVKGNTPESVKIDGNNRFNYTDTWTMDGEKVTTTATSALLGNKGLYLIGGRDNDDFVSSLANGWFIPVIGKAGQAATEYATYAKNGVLSVNQHGANQADVAANGQMNFSYDDNTKFLVVELKLNNTDIAAVRTGSISDIEVVDNDNPIDEYTTGVYVVSVDDETDATPVAEIVMIVVPDV